MLGRHPRSVLTQAKDCPHSQTRRSRAETSNLVTRSFRALRFTRDCLGSVVSLRGSPGYGPGRRGFGFERCRLRGRGLVLIAELRAQLSLRDEDVTGDADTLNLAAADPVADRRLRQWCASGRVADAEQLRQGDGHKFASFGFWPLVTF